MKLDKQTLIDRLIDHRWITEQPIPMKEVTTEIMDEEYWCYHRNYGFFLCTVGSHEVVMSTLYMLENLDEFTKLIDEGLSEDCSFKNDIEFFYEEIECFAMDGWDGEYNLDEKFLEMKGTAYVSSLQCFGDAPLRVGYLSNLSPYERRFFGRYFNNFREMLKEE